MLKDEVCRKGLPFLWWFLVYLNFDAPKLGPGAMKLIQYHCWSKSHFYIRNIQWKSETEVKSEPA